MAAQQQQQGSSDNSMDLVWIGILAVISGYVFWALAHKYVVQFIFLLNIIQAELVDFVVPGSPLSEQVYFMQTVDYSTVSWDQLVVISQEVGNYFRYPVLLMGIVMAILLYRSDITLAYRRMHDMKTLRAQEQENWPAIMPVVPLDLAAENINQGPWAMALTPMEFARKHNLLKKNDVLLDNPVPGDEMTAGIRRGDTKRVFTMQLGSPWEGFERCPPHVQALAATFAARLNRDRPAANMILEAIDRTVVSGKPNFEVAIPIIRKYQDSELVKEIVSKHAYVLTVMASLLEGARDDGVVPSSEFLWLKTIDRRLWFMLNSVGRQTPYAEVGGPFGHWKAEKAMGRGTLVPMIDETIKALEVAVREVRLSPKELAGLQP